MNVDLLVRKPTQTFDFNVEKLALFGSQTRKDDHPDATAHPEDDVNDCLLAVITALVIVAQAVGKPVSLALLTGGESAAARAICRKVFSDDCNQGIW